MDRQKKYGVLLSYISIGLNMVFNLVLIPLLITALSDADYSIYKVIQSFTGPLIMFNMGLYTIVARSMAQYQGDAGEGKIKKENTFALSLMIAVFMSVFVFCLGVAMTRLVPVLFGKTYSLDQIQMAKKLLFVFVGTTALHILNDVFRGCLVGCGKFIMFYGGSTIHYVFRFLGIIVLTRFTDCSAVGVALVDFFVYLAVFLVNVVYTVFLLRERPRLHFISRHEIVSIASFSAAILLQAVVNQVNNNVDNVILGAMIEQKETITMYSSALSIYSVYNTLISVIPNIYLPKAARLVQTDYTARELTDFVIEPSRIQAIMAVAVVFCFGLFGGDFIGLWIGQEYVCSYYVALILLVAATVPLVQSVCVSILDVKLKRMFRSITLVVMAFLNVLVSVFFVKRMGFWGAALGTAVSLLIGEVLIMNIYYHKSLGLETGRMFREIFRGILPAGVLSTVCCIPLVLFLESTALLFLLKCIMFIALYAVFLWLFGLNNQEKTLVRAVIKRN